MVIFINIARQYELLKEETDRHIQQILNGDDYTFGSEIGELRRRLSEFTGVRNVGICSSGFGALHAIMTAWGTGAGGAVLVPALITPAAVKAIRMLNAVPIFVDIDPDTYNINPCSLEGTILSILKDGNLKPKFIITVDTFGLPADYAAIELIASKYGIKIIEDATQAIGAECIGRKAGSFGNAAFSAFSPPRSSSCYGDIGVVFSNDHRLEEFVRSIDNSEEDGLVVVKAAGILPRLTLLEEELKLRSRAAGRYESKLKGIVKTPFVPEGTIPAWSRYCVVAGDEREREGIRRRMQGAGIPVEAPFERSLWLEEAGAWKGEFPGAEMVRRRALLLPMHAYLTDEGIDEIVRAMRLLF